MAADIITQGCRLNVYESEVIRRHTGALDNTIIINTCAVTGEAERQARQAIRKARRENPDAEIVVTGCAAQIHPDDFAAMDEVSRVVGNTEKLEASAWQADAPKLAVNDIMSVTETAGHLLDGFVEHTRAFVQVQQGCDHRCTFCIIPFGRGNSRSVAAGPVVDQVRRLVEGGVKEVVLTGVDMTSYGADLPGSPKLGNLVQRILKLVPELPRLRLSSIDSIEIDDALLDVIANEPRLMPHLHLSLQAGADMVLKRMKRRHLRDDAIRVARQLRDLRPDIVFGADFITGFPTETEEQFQQTLDLTDEAGLTYLHVFPYSERPGTPAARMPSVDKAVRKERAARLRTKGQAREAAFFAAQSGSVQAVLMEKNGIGRTPHFAPVACDAPAGSLYDMTLARGGPLSSGLEGQPL